MMTAQATDNHTESFCANPKCNFHRISVSMACTSLEAGDIKVERMFFSKGGILKPIKLCATCAAVVPMFVSCEVETVLDGPEIWTPGDKQIITSLV